MSVVWVSVCLDLAFAAQGAAAASLGGDGNLIPGSAFNQPWVREWGVLVMREDVRG